MSLFERLQNFSIKCAELGPFALPDGPRVKPNPTVEDVKIATRKFTDIHPDEPKKPCTQCISAERNWTKGVNAGFQGLIGVVAALIFKKPIVAIPVGMVAGAWSGYGMYLMSHVPCSQEVKDEYRKRLTLKGLEKE